MIEDRDYMRQPEFGQSSWRNRFRLRWTWTTMLVATYVAVLIAEQIADRFFQQEEFINTYFALSLEGMKHGYAWQLFTYQFMHAGWMHLLLNAWAIFIFGNELEQLLGVRRYLTLLFSSGVVGGIVQILTALVWPQLFGGWVVGASAGAFGLVAAFAMLFPERELTMLIFFIIPVQLRAKTLLILCAVIALMGIIFPLNNVANAAHLGGMAMGWFYVKGILKSPALLGVAEEEKPRRLVPVKAEKMADHFEDGDVDAILDKISARGINSLTARERAVLEAARKKMAQR
jgi:membrane associated rhomboid family serine protease